MKGGALVLLMQLLVVMILSFPCANAHMSVDIAGEEAAHQRLLWLTSTAQSISGQMEQLLGGDGQGISSLATLRGMGEWMYSRIWSQVGADVEEVPGSVPPPMRSREDRSLLEQHFTSSTLEVPLKAVASQTSADVGPSTQFRCNGGSFAVLNNAQFQCPWSGTLAPQQMAWIPYSQRVGCTRVGGQSSTYSPESWGQMCVCTPDYVPMIKKGTVDCFPRPLSVSVELDPQYRCRREEDLGATDIPPYYPNDYCLVAERKGIVQFTVKLRSSWMLDDELRGVMDESKGVAVLPSPLASSTEEWVTSATVDTYAGIARSVTWYIVYPTVVGDGFSFCISQNNYLFSYINKFSTVFSFTEPEVMDSTTKLDALTSPYSNLFRDLFGGKDGTAATGGYTVSYDLSSVPDACLEGGAMYMETGLQSVQQLFMGYAVARIHISFPNLSKPSDKTFSYKVGLSSAYIFLIVCACLIVMGAVLALGRRLYRRNQQQRAQAKSDALTKTAE